MSVAPRIRAGLLYGRGIEHRALRLARDDVERDGARVVLVEGAPGIGKSLLLEAFADEERAEGRVATVVRPRERAGALDALRDLVGARLGPTAHADAARSLDRAVVGGANVTVEAPAGLARAAAELAASLAAVLGADGRVETLIVDDLHHLDGASELVLAALLERLLAEARRRRVLVLLGSWPAPVLLERDDVVRLVDGSPRGSRLRLEPLDEADEADLVRDVVPGAGVGYVELVRRLSQGVPLRIHGAVAVLRGRGVTPSVVAGDPQALRDAWLDDPHQAAVTQRWLDVLDEECRDLVVAAAVYGAECTADDVRAVAAPDMDPDHVAERLDRAVAVGVLDTDGHCYWFRHGELREAAARRGGPAVFARAHARCARRKMALRAAGESGLDVEIADHLLRAEPYGAAGERFELFRRAGIACFASSEWRRAGTFLEAALAERHGVDEAAQAAATLEAGLSHYYRQDTAAAARRLREAAAMARVLGDQASWSLAVVAQARAENTLYERSERRPVDRAPLHELLEAVDDPALRADVCVTLAEICSTEGDVEAASAIAERAVAEAERSGDIHAIAMASFAGGFAALVANDVPRSERLLRRAVRVASGGEDWYLLAHLRIRLALTLVVLGELEEADALLDRALEACTARAEHLGIAFGAAVRCQVAYLRGDFAAAERLGAIAAASTRRSRYALAFTFFLPALFLARVRQGGDGAAELRREFDRDWPLARRLGARVALETGVLPDDVRARSDLRARTQVMAGRLVLETELAVVARDRHALAALVEELLTLDQAGVVWPASYPVAVPMVCGAALMVLGRHDEAAAMLGRAIEIGRRAGAVVDMAGAAFARAQLEAGRPGGSVDLVRRRCADASAWADAVGMTTLARRADALARIGIDARPAVHRRGSRWCVVLFTDLVGSSRVSTRLGDVAYFEFVQRHHALVRAQVVRYGGTEIGDGGDGLLSWFGSTAEAVAAAHGIRDVALLDAPGPGGALAIKIGLAGGEPFWNAGRPYGQIVNRAARLVALAAGGEIVVDEAVASDLDAPLPADAFETVELKNMGPHRIARIRGSITSA